MTDVVDETEVVETETETARIPEALAGNVILQSIAQKYIDVIDEISEYNKAVLQSSKSEWTNAKLLEKAREMGRPADPKKDKPHAEILKLLQKMENAQEELNFARQAVLASTASELGVERDTTTERDADKEAALKTKRGTAAVIGTQLTQIADLTADPEASAAVKEFLKNNALPAVGRNQSTSFGEDAKPASPKYRTIVKVEKDGNVLLEENGFAKTAAQLSKPIFGYDRGKALKADKLREVYEKAGNSADKPDAVSPVTFTDNGLTYTITYNA